MQHGEQLIESGADFLSYGGFVEDAAVRVQVFHEIQVGLGVEDFCF